MSSLKAPRAVWKAVSWAWAAATRERGDGELKWMQLVNRSRTSEVNVRHIPNASILPNLQSTCTIQVTLIIETNLAAQKSEMLS